MNAFGLAPLLLIFPIVGVLFNIFAGRHLVDADKTSGEKIAGWFAAAMSLACFAVAILLALSLPAVEYHAQTVYLFDWFNIPSADFYVPWAMYIDTLSSTMTLVITGVGSLIHIYAIGYMHGDKDFAKFFVYLNMFIFFMLILVTGSSYLMLFVGWEGVGLCSFLLIGFWFDKPHGVGLANNRAARKAFIANRVGDFAMILAMILTFWVFGSMQFESVFGHAIEMFEAQEMVHLTILGSVMEFTLGGVLTTITALFLIGAAGKSAQIPLYIWLPDAMAGPTPVSALIHAATMVTSGIYLITRSNVLFEIVRESGYLLFGLISSNDLVALTGAVTALFAGLIAFTQFDIKKVLAYSTVSQLGFMIAAVGMGAYVAGMFHLVTHAFFKALLFMGSGSVIHGMEHGHHHMHEHQSHDDHHGHEEHHDDHHSEAFDPQDMRTMGGLRHKMPWTFWTYMAGTLALAGIPIFAGFWSKDEILAHAAVNHSSVFTVVYWLLVAAAFCTAFYMGRQIKMTFFGKPRHEAVKYVPESVPTMVFPLVVLAFLSTFGGFLNTPFFNEEVAHTAEESHNLGSYLLYEQWLEHSLASFHLTEEGVVHMPHTPIVLQINVALISTVLALIALALSLFVVYRNRPQTAGERDPLQSTPIWVMSILPLDTLFVKGFVERVFNPFSDWLAEKFDWAFWHDFVHDNLIRDSFVTAADFLRDTFDPKGVDGLVNGAGYTARRLANIIRTTQTGNVGNYALSLFLGVVIVVAYFVLMAN